VSTTPSAAEPPDKYDVFISHATAEREVALRLRQALVDVGLRPWASFVDIPLGTHYAEEIVRGIMNCRAVVVLVSNASMRSPYVTREILSAVSSKVDKPLLPIHIEKEVSIPPALSLFLQGRHYLSVTPDSIERAASVVFAALRDPHAWEQQASAPTMSDRLLVWRRRLWLPTIGIAFAAALVAWGLQYLTQQYVAADAARQRDALPESLALLSVTSAERATGQGSEPWALQMNVTLAGPQARFSDLRLIVSVEQSAGDPELFDLTPAFAKSQVGGGQMLTAVIPKLSPRLTVCLSLPHPSGGGPHRVRALFQGQLLVSEGKERITYLPSGSAIASEEDGSPCR
jgi:hypothetical protein